MHSELEWRALKLKHALIKVDFKSPAAHVKIFPLTRKAFACSQGPLQSADIPNTHGLHGFGP